MVEDIVEIDGKIYKPGDVIREIDRGTFKIRIIYGGKIKKEEKP